MAISTGTATGAAAVLDAIVAFLTANGWTVFDTLIASNDVVLMSAGTTGKAVMYARLTINTSTNNPFKNTPYHMAKCVPGLMLRGYSTWSTGTHTGTGEYGMMGPILKRNDAVNTHDAFYRVDPMTSMLNGYDLQHLLHGTTVQKSGTAAIIGGRYSVQLDGNWSGLSQRFAFIDLITGEFWLSSAVGVGTYMCVCLPTAVYDSASDKWFLYICPSVTAGNQADAFWKYDIEADTWTRLAASPWNLAQNQGGGLCLWDGADYIYVVPTGATGGTAFYRYSISGNSWTSLGVLPATRAAYTLNSAVSTATNTQNAIYVPAAVSGLSSDVIYMVLEATVTTLYCYNITTGLWNDSAHGTPNLTMPFTPTATIPVGIVWDYQRYAYFWCGTALTQSAVYRLDLTNTAGGFGSGSLILPAYNTSWEGCSMLHHPVGHLHIHPSNLSTYWLFGDAESFQVCVKGGFSTTHYYWMHFGRALTRHRSALMTSTAGVSAGTNVSIPVDSSAAYAANDTILLFDQANNQTELATIYAVPDDTHIQATIAHNYASGSLIGTDPWQSCITGGQGWCVAATDPKGYKSDYQTAHYWLLPVAIPLVTEAVKASTLSWAVGAPNGMAYYQLWEALGQQPYTNFNYPLASQGYYGAPANIFFLPKQPFPAPQSEDTLFVNGKVYYFFAQADLRQNPIWQYGVVLGSPN